MKYFSNKSEGENLSRKHSIFMHELAMQIIYKYQYQYSNQNISKQTVQY